MFGLSRQVFSGKSNSGRKARHRLQVEALEQRDLMASMAGLTLDGLIGHSPADAADPRTVNFTGGIQGTFTSTSTGTLTGVGGIVGQTTGTILDPGPEPTAAGLKLINSLLDANVRSRALAAYQTDGVISRNDMLDIFFNGSVGYTDLTNTAFLSMNAVVYYGHTLGMPEYVQVLGTKVLDQKPLDSLSPAQTLKRSVDNFFLGLNRPQTDIGYSYVQVNKPLFVNGVSAADVDNPFVAGGAGFNWFLSTLAEGAWRTPGDIERMFIDNGDHTYTVRFPIGTYADYVTVDNYLARPTGVTTGDYYYGAGSSEMWVHLLMKAYVQLNEEGAPLQSLQPGVNSYDAIKQRILPDNTLNPVNPSWVLSRLSGGFGTMPLEPYTVTYGDHDGTIRSHFSFGWYVMLKTSHGADELLGSDRWYALVNYAHDPASTDEWYTVTQDGKRFVQVKGLVLADNFDQAIFTANTSLGTSSRLVGVGLPGAGVVDTAGPEVTDLRLAATKTGISAVVLHFDEALDAASAADLAHYRLTTAGKDGRFGTADDKVVPVRLATYDDAHHTVSLTPLTPLRLGTFYQVTASGVTDAAGNALDQDGDGTADSYVVSFARGPRLSYTEADGDRVSLALSRGGAIELTSGPGGEGLHLRLVDTVGGKSVLTGTVTRKNAASDGLTSLGLSGTQGVDIHRLTAAASRVRVTALEVAVLDAALAALLDGGPAQAEQN